MLYSANGSVIGKARRQRQQGSEYNRKWLVQWGEIITVPRWFC